MPAWSAPVSDRLDVEDCLARAAECEEEARCAKNEAARQVYRQLADHRRLLADIAGKGGNRH